MNESWNDNLFKFFRSKLNDTQNFSEDWSTPPDEVFHRAMDEVRLLKRRRRRKVLLPILMVLGGIVLLSVGIGVYHQMNDINDKVDHVEEAVIDLKSQEDEMAVSGDNAIREHDFALINEKSNTASGVSDIEEKGANETDLTGRRSRTEYLTHTFDAVPSAVDEAAITESQIRLEQLNPLSSQDQASYTDTRIEKESMFASVRAVDLLDRRSTGVTSASFWPIEVSKTMDLYPAVKTTGGRLSLAVALGHNISSLSMTNVGKSSGTLTEYDRYYSGAGIQTTMEYHINDRWSLSVTGGYDRLNNQSRLADQMMYDSDQEMHDAAGNSFYQTELTLETPLGSFRRAADISMSEVTMQDGDMIRNVTGINQHLDIANIAVGGRYHFISQPRWVGFIGSGLGLDLVMRSNSKMESSISMKDQLKEDFTTQADQLDYLSQHFSAIYGEVGAKYRIRKHVSILVNAKFRRSLTSLRESGNDLEPKTFLQQFKTAAGLEYKF